MAKRGRKVEIPQPKFNPETGAPLDAPVPVQEDAPVQEEERKHYYSRQMQSRCLP